MTIEYGSMAHIMYILIALLLVFLLYFLFRGKSEKMQKTVVVILMVLNILQHLFKAYIYPQYAGAGFSSLNSAYNMCALLILISPIAYFSKSETLRDFVFPVGSVAGIIAVLVPYWHIGESAFTWDVYRFFICHALLFASSLLPLLFGHHKPSWRSFWKIGLIFFAAIAFILINDIVFITMGKYHGAPEGAELYEVLLMANPCWSIAPPDAFPFVFDIVKIFSPPIFTGDNPNGMIVPVMWYFIPLYIGITLLAFIVLGVMDKENFVPEMKSLFAKLSSLFGKKSENGGKSETEEADKEEILS